MDKVELCDSLSEQIQQSADAAMGRTDLLLLDMSDTDADNRQTENLLQELAHRHPQRLMALHFEQPRQPDMPIGIRSMLRGQQTLWHGMTEELMAEILSIGMIMISGIDVVLEHWHCAISRMLAWCAHHCTLTIATTRFPAAIATLDLPNVHIRVDRLLHANEAQIRASQKVSAALIDRLVLRTDPDPEASS